MNHQPVVSARDAFLAELADAHLKVARLRREREPIRAEARAAQKAMHGASNQLQAVKESFEYSLPTSELRTKFGDAQTRAKETERRYLELSKQESDLNYAIDMAVARVNALRRGGGERIPQNYGTRFDVFYKVWRDFELDVP